jgi:hypothetical protein
MSSPTPYARLLAPLALAALLATSAGCGGDERESAAPPPSDPSSSSASASETPSESSTPAETPSETPDETPSETTTPGPPALDTLLLPGSGLPGFNDTWTWAVKGTGPQRSPFGICQRFPMEDLGAAQTVVRRYRPAGDLTGGTGGHLVSRFVDDRSASQTVQVLQSWHDRCMERLARFETKRVSRMTSVTTSRGTASWYLVTHAGADADQGRFDALGVLRDGSTVELLMLNLEGQDYNYEQGKEPMVQALRSAADRLAG